MLDALVAGTTDPEVLADLAQRQAAQEAAGAARGAGGPLRRRARADRRRDPRPHRLPRRADRPALRRDRGAARPFRPRPVELLCTIPGVQRRTAEVIIAEIGADMTKFPTAGHLASGPACAPATTSPPANAAPAARRKGSKWLRQTLTECRQGRQPHQRHLPRRAIRAAPAPAAAPTARSAPSRTRSSIACWHMLQTGETYRDPGGDYYQPPRPRTHDQTPRRPTRTPRPHRHPAGGCLTTTGFLFRYNRGAEPLISRRRPCPPVLVPDRVRRVPAGYGDLHARKV